MPLLLHARLVQKLIFVWRGVGWALINFLGFQGGCLFKGGRLIKENTVRVAKASPGNNLEGQILAPVEHCKPNCGTI